MAKLRTTLSRFLIGMACLGAATGCGGEDVALSFCEITAASGANSTAESRSNYPSGPFGIEVCDRIENLSFTTTDEKTLSLQDIRSNPDARLLLISTSAGWCAACIEEQPVLEDLYNTRNEKGLEVMVALFQDAVYSPASAALAQQWTDQFELNLKVVADPAKDTGDLEFALSPYYDTNLTPMNMLVDLESMTILEINVGWNIEMVSIIDAMLQ